ncbi:pyridoxamine 5'-phosphate oxidase family protein [Cyclobacterium amurskyense]|uniref:Putative general stress protein 26 n=1 Tax=Cyclobacterium amurskyense TaxID=320787 RepID=A0A0H4PJ50_9BACT|nr:pyridoxamine 5'-phosphate oxidase family protein [Cyclobacterium amurskyense]AKP54154.1 Putative general stress protein 26 [Cyclobacterium amurskyense]
MSKENLFNREAIDKLKELAEGIQIAILETSLKSLPPHTVPMSTKEVDDEGCIWFLSSEKSVHNQNIDTDNSVQLIYSNPKEMKFLTIFGQAIVYKGRVILERYYEKADNAWFDGVSDPDLTAIKVIPKEAHYWDTENGKFINLLKMGISAVTGNSQDLGTQGDLKISIEEH